MFETDEFYESLRQAVSSEAARHNMKQYETGIVFYLQTLAVDNERYLMESEQRKPPSARRGIQEALASAQELMQTASAKALAERRTLVTLEDIKGAYEERFCRVWPYCR